MTNTASAVAELPADAVHNIRPELLGSAVPIGSISTYPGNPRRADRQTLKDSLHDHGQYQTVLVQRSTGYIVVGNNRHDVAADDLGWTHIAATYLDLDDETARRMVAVDNKSSDGAGYDKTSLAVFLAGFDGLDGTGWSFDEYDDLLTDLQEAGAAALAELPADDPTTLVGLFSDPEGAVPAAVTTSPPAVVNPFGPVPAVLPEVPKTDAAYAETDEEMAARQERMAAHQTHRATGHTEMILIYTPDDRAEANRLIAAAKGVLGQDVTSPDVILRGLRVLAAFLDPPHDKTPITLSALAKVADLSQDE